MEFEILNGVIVHPDECINLNTAYRILRTTNIHTHENYLEIYPEKGKPFQTSFTVNEKEFNTIKKEFLRIVFEKNTKNIY